MIPAEELPWLRPQLLITLSTFKHSWLDNKICGVELLYFRHYLADEHWKSFKTLAVERLAGFAGLLRDYEHEASPASLLARLRPLQNMPEPLRLVWAVDLHERFLANYDVRAVLASVSAARGECERSLLVLDGISDEAARKEAQAAATFYHAARRMREGLNRLPKWIPPP